MTNPVPFLDLRAAYAELREEIDTAVSNVLSSGWYVLGPEVEAFEAEFASYSGSSHAIGVANGLDALTLALRALEVGPGDEVVVPSNTFIATWLAVTQCGAVPVPVEPTAHGFNLDPARVEAAITRRTKAIVPVHLYGEPCDIDTILSIARTRGIRIVEDAAQAHGALYKGRRIGAHSDAVAWSFYPGKNLGAFGDGGAVTTNDPGIANQIQLLRNYGSRQKYVHEVAGYNSRLDPVQAAVLRVKLRHLDRWNARRTAIASKYNAALADCPITLPQTPPWATPSWHLYVVRHPNRDLLREALEKDGIQTLIHYPVPPHKQKAYCDSRFDAGDFPLANGIASEVLSLPMGPHLSDHCVLRVISSVSKALHA